MKKESAIDWNNKGIALYELQDYQGAIGCYDKALGLNPKYGAAWNNKGVALCNLKDYQGAIGCYDKALELDHEYESAWYNKGNALYKLQDYKGAIGCYDKALELDSKDESAWNNKGVALCNLKDYKGAVDCFKKSGRDILGILTALDENKRKTISSFLKPILDTEPFFKGITNKIPAKDLDKYKKLYIRSISIISLLHVTEEEHVAYYTKKAISQNLLFKEDSKFRLNAITYSNDPKEGETLLDYLFDDRAGYPIKNREYSAFAGCFTFNHDCLNQFRLYGKEDDKEGTGVSIVFKKRFFNNEAKLATQNITGVTIDGSKSIGANKKGDEGKFSLFRCIYIDPRTGYVSVGQREEYTFYKGGKEKDRDKVAAEIRTYKQGIDKIIKRVRKGLDELKGLVNGLDYTVVSQLLMNLRYLTKHVAFKEEQECRIVKIMPLTDKGIKRTDDFKQLYIEYSDIKNHVEKIYFAPKAVDMELFSDMLKNERLQIDCEKSEHPFA